MSTPTQIPITAARREHTSTEPLRSYLFLLAPRMPSLGGPVVIHYVLEESPERAIQVCDQSCPDHRIIALRDVTDHATAA
jgi:hypothetical protein